MDRLAAFIDKKFTEHVTIDGSQTNKEIKDICKLEYLLTFFEAQANSANSFADDILE